MLGNIFFLQPCLNHSCAILTLKIYYIEVGNCGLDGLHQIKEKGLARRTPCIPFSLRSLGSFGFHHSVSLHIPDSTNIILLSLLGPLGQTKECFQLSNTGFLGNTIFSHAIFTSQISFSQLGASCTNFSL